MSRPSLLFLTQRLPYPPNKGEKIRPFNLIKHFSKSYDIYLGTLIDDAQDWQHVDMLRPFVKELKVVGLNKAAAYAGMGIRWLGGMPLSFGFFQNSELQSWVLDVVNRVKPDVAFLCSSNTAAYLMRTGFRPNCVIADFADVDSQKWYDYVASKSGPMCLVYAEEAKRVRREELKISNASDAVTFVSLEETELFKQVCPSVASKAFAISSGVDTDYFSPDFQAPSMLPVGPGFVFTGTMDYWPNVNAVTWFAEHVWQTVRAALPDANFAIVGSKPSAEVQKLATIPGIIVTGRIPDVRPYVAAATAVIAPLQIARGIQNKVLEGMAMGKAVITSAGALTGIAAVPGKHVWQADSPAEWQAACLALAADNTRCLELGLAARHFILDRFSWSSTLKPLDDLIKATVLQRTNSGVSGMNN